MARSATSGPDARCLNSRWMRDARPSWAGPVHTPHALCRLGASRRGARGKRWLRGMSGQHVEQLGANVAEGGHASDFTASPWQPGHRGARTTVPFLGDKTFNVHPLQETAPCPFAELCCGPISTLCCSWPGTAGQRAASHSARYKSPCRQSTGASARGHGDSSGSPARQHRAHPDCRLPVGSRPSAAQAHTGDTCSHLPRLCLQL